jgi:uncharacterized membrane protein YphA (DoxX/SURF4 family)
MSLAAKLRRAPERIVTGAFIINSGLSKLSADDDVSKGVHGMATGAYPAFGRVHHKAFTRALGVGETALGSALLLPFVRARWAGLGLMAFSGGLLGMYWRTPGTHQEGNPRPTQQGIALAKDVWMFGIGTSLFVDDVVTDTGATRKVHRAQRRARRAERRLAKTERREKIEDASSRLERIASAGLHHARDAVGSAADVARDRADAARSRAEDATHRAATTASQAAGAASTKLADVTQDAALSVKSYAQDAAAQVKERVPV